VGEIADQADADADEAHAAKANGHASPRDIKDESAKNGYFNGNSNGHSNGAYVTDVTVENGVASKSATAVVGKCCQISKTNTILCVQEIMFIY
jgi:hypothetical protein